MVPTEIDRDSMGKVTVMVALRLTYEPHLDSTDDILKRVKDEIKELIHNGHLEGCEHGAHIDSWNLDADVVKIDR